MLFKEQAMDILEDEGAVQLNLKRRRRRRRKKRKITPLPEKQWSQFPIPYTFDGTHSECSQIPRKQKLQEFFLHVISNW